MWQHAVTINLHLHLLQAILVPVLQLGGQGWGMHSPRVAAASDAQRLVLHCNVCMITISELFAVFHHLLLASSC